MRTWHTRGKILILHSLKPADEPLEWSTEPYGIRARMNFALLAFRMLINACALLGAIIIATALMFIPSSATLAPVILFADLNRHTTSPGWSMSKGGSELGPLIYFSIDQL